MPDCQERLDERYGQYMQDVAAGAGASGEQIAGNLLDSAKGYVAGLASKYASDMINEFIEKSGIRDAVTALATTLAMLLTIGPQMYLALFSVCVDIIKKQTEKRIEVAIETRELLDIVIGVFDELLTLPNPKGTLIQRIRNASGRVKNADAILGQVIDMSAQGAPFPSNRYETAIDYVGSAIDFLGGGDGKGRPQTDPSSLSDFVDEDGDPEKIFAKYKSDVTGGTFDREAERLERLWKKIKIYAQMSGMSFIGIMYRTIALAEVITAAKSQFKEINPTVTAGSWTQIKYRDRIINIEPDRAGLMGLSSAITLSIAGLESLDKYVGGAANNFSAFELIIKQLVTELLRQKGQLKNIYLDMDTVVAENNSSMAIPKSAGWTVKLESVWQLGQSGGPVGAVAEDMSELQEQLDSYKELKEYLSSDVDWSRGYQALAALVLKNAGEIIKAPYRGEHAFSGLSKLFNALVRMREITAYGIKSDQELIQRINRFDGDTPLLQEAKKLLGKLQGGLGASIASGRADQLMGQLAEYAGQVGAIVATVDQITDLACARKVGGLGYIDADPSEELENKGDVDTALRDEEYTKATAESTPHDDTARQEQEENDIEESLDDFMAELLDMENYDTPPGVN